MHNDVKCVFMICTAQCTFAMRTAAHNKYAQRSVCLLFYCCT